MKRASVFLAAIAVTAACGSVPPAGHDYFGDYYEVPLRPGGVVWEGDQITLSAEGYRHSRFTDEIGPWLAEPPYVPYTGTFEVQGTTIRFLDSLLDSDELIYVNDRGAAYLLSPAEYRVFRRTGDLPASALKRR